MSRKLRVISINFPFKNSSVTYESSLLTSHALFDFDVVVVRPYFLHRTSDEGQLGGVYEVPWSELDNAKQEIRRKIEDLQRLLRQGRLLVVILDVIQTLEAKTHGYSIGESRTVTNYDFLDSQFSRCVRNGTGVGVEYVDPTDPFSRVIKDSAVQWTAFISGAFPYPFNEASVFARNGAGSFIGGSVEWDSGHIVFLPNFRDLNESRFLEACLDYRFERQGTPPPAWVSSIFLPGEGGAMLAISGLDGEISRVQGLRDEELKKRDALVSCKKLLFEKGKHQLEPVVREALDRLGFQTSPGENIPGTQFEIDGRTKGGSVPGILEIKGSRNLISLDEFSPFVPKILADLEKTQIHSKGVLVANGLCSETPEKRLGDVVFSPHVLAAAKTTSIALINSVELYCVICAVLDGQIPDCIPIREKILTSNGYVDLRAFSTTSPFKELGVPKPVTEANSKAG